MLKTIVRQAVLDAIREGRTTLEEIRTEAERAFDQVMDRCSGWYKRRSQKFLLLFATILTLGLNVDAFHVADRLAKDDVLRAAVIEKAAEVTDAPGAGESKLDPVPQQVDDVEQLGLPLGWSQVDLDDVPLEVLRSLPGYLLTILAVMLGAPFWFDVLGRFAKLRNTGNREGTVKDDGRAPVDRDARPT